MIQTLPFEKLHYQFFLKDNLFVVESSASITFEDILVHVGNLMNDEQFHIGLNGLYDFSQLKQVTGDHDAFLATAEAMSDHDIIAKPAKTAILVADDSPDIYNIFHSYVLMTSDSLIEYQLFTSSEITNLLSFLEIEQLPDID